MAHNRNLYGGQTSSLREHVIIISREGRLLSPETRKPIPRLTDVLAYLDAIIDKYTSFLAARKQQDPDNKLPMTIFVHGGLNSPKPSLDRVRKFRHVMLKDKKYPVFINWQSGLLSAYGEHLTSIRQGEVWPVMGPITSPAIFFEDLLRVVGRLPLVYFRMFVSHNSVYRSVSSKNEDFEHVRLLDLRTKWSKFHDHFILGGSGNDELNFFFFVPSLNPFKLLSAPAIDMVGLPAWKIMLRRARLLYRPHSEFTDYEEPTNSGSEMISSGIISLFFARLLEKKNPAFDMELLGHSMGAIIANDALKRFPNLPVSKIVYMGAACSVRDLELSVVPFLLREDHKKTEFYNLVLHPYNELLENRSYSFGPRGSLLEWIDQIFESPRIFQDRRAGKWYNIIRSAQIFPAKIRSRVFVRRYQLNSGGPDTHGAFGQYLFYQLDFWKDPEYEFQTIDERLRKEALTLP